MPAAKVVETWRVKGKKVRTVGKRTGQTARRTLALGAYNKNEDKNKTRMEELGTKSAARMKEDNWARTASNVEI